MNLVQLRPERQLKRKSRNTYKLDLDKDLCLYGGTPIGIAGEKQLDTCGAIGPKRTLFVSLSDLE